MDQANKNELERPLKRAFSIRDENIMYPVTAASIAINSHSALLANQDGANLVLDTINLAQLVNTIRKKADVVRVLNILFVGTADRASIQTLKNVIKGKKNIFNQKIEEKPIDISLQEMQEFQMDQIRKEQKREGEFIAMEQKAEEQEIIKNKAILTTSEAILNAVDLGKILQLQNAASSQQEFETAIQYIQYQTVRNYAIAILPNLQEMIRLAKNTVLSLVLELKLILNPEKNKKYTAKDITQVSYELKLAMMELRDAIHTLFDMLQPAVTQQYLQIYSVTNTDLDPQVINSIAIADKGTTSDQWNVMIKTVPGVLTQTITPDNDDDIEQAKSFVDGKVIFENYSPYTFKNPKAKGTKPQAKIPTIVDETRISGLLDKIKKLSAFSYLQGITLKDILTYLIGIGFNLIVINNVACNHVVAKIGDNYTGYVSNNAATTQIRTDFQQLHAENKILMTDEQAQYIGSEVSEIIKTDPDYKELHAYLIESVLLFDKYKELRIQAQAQTGNIFTGLPAADKKEAEIQKLVTEIDSIFHFDEVTAFSLIVRLIPSSILDANADASGPIDKKSRSESAFADVSESVAYSVIRSIKDEFLTNNFSDIPEENTKKRKIGGSRHKRSRRRKHGSNKKMRRAKAKKTKKRGCRRTKKRIRK